MELRYFELSDDKSSKFWEISAQGTEVTTRWGRIGTAGQTKTKTYDTAQMALAAASKAAAGKIRKGYTEYPADTSDGPESGDGSESTTSMDGSEGLPTPAESWERVFARDLRADFPEEIGNTMSYCGPPFASRSSSAATSEPHLLPENRQKWFVQLWDGRHGWVSLFCNCADGKTVFEESCCSRRLEMVHFGYDDQQRGWFFRCQRAGKRHVDFELPIRVKGDLTRAKFKAAELSREFLDGCGSGQDVIEKLCREFAIAEDSVRLDCSGQRPEIVNGLGEPAKAQVRAYSCNKAPGLEVGDDPAADLLNEGVAALDPHIIRRAIEQGADVSRLPGRDVTPLQMLLRRCPDPRVQECVAVLTAFGVSLESEPGYPVVIEHTSHIDPEEQVVGKLNVLVSLGADVNAVHPRHGETVLFDNVRRRRTLVVRCLIKLGADPQIRNGAGQSVIDIIQDRIAQAPSSPGVSIGALPRRRDESADDWQVLLDIVQQKRPAEQASSQSTDRDSVGGSRDRVDPEVSQSIRQRISDETGAAIEELTPQTNLVNEFGMDQERLTSILVPVCIQFKVSITALLKQIGSDCGFDEQGYLTDGSKTRLQQILPAFPVDDWEVLTETDVFMSVAFLEAMVTAAIDLRRADEVVVDDLPIGGLDERQQRLLLTGTFRYLWQFTPDDRMRPELSDALDALEVFADTGRTKTALRRARSSFRGTYIHSRKPWRNAPEMIAIDAALENEDHRAALWHLVQAMKQILDISAQKALSRLAELAADIAAPAGVREAFQVEWRSPQIVELAQEMYSARNFLKMRELAEALQDAGCDNDLVLNHCREASRWHMRGCWVVDAVLDGSWAAPVKKPRRRKKGLMQQLPRSAQLSIRRQADSCFVELSFEEFIARLWDVESSESVRRKNAVDYVEERRSRVAEKFQGLSMEQIDVYVSLEQIDWRLRNCCLVRRVLREDPSEAGRGLSVLYRVRNAIPGLWSPEFDEVCPLYATHHADIARRVSSKFLAHNVDRKVRDFDYIDLRQLACASIIEGDARLLSQLWAEMAKGKKPPWLIAWYVVLKAIADRDPTAVADGLQEFLARYRHVNRDLDAVINFDAHGLYRLAESLDPELVAGFDTQQGRPWDAEFHAWSAANRDPLSGVDLSGVSAELHQLVIEGSPPDWIQQLLT